MLNREVLAAALGARHPGWDSFCRDLRVRAAGRGPDASGSWGLPQAAFYWATMFPVHSPFQEPPLAAGLLRGEHITSLKGLQRVSWPGVVGGVRWRTETLTWGSLCHNRGDSAPGSGTLLVYNMLTYNPQGWF